MLSYKEMEKYAKTLNLPLDRKRQILTEYLQYEVLQSIFSHRLSTEISFMGGTAIHIVHASKRFSEDLDFDNLELNFRDFCTLMKGAENSLISKGFDVESQFKRREAFHGHLKFLNLLQRYKISFHKEEKILIKVDAQKQNYRKIKREKFLISNYGVNEIISVNSADILLSQKILTILEHHRTKARDFYDISYLLGFTKPNYDYLNFKIKIKNPQILKIKLKTAITNVDLKTLAREISPLTFDPNGEKRILNFKYLIDKF